MLFTTLFKKQISKTTVKLIMTTLCGALMIQMIAGCAGSSRKSKAPSDASSSSSVSYKMIAQPGAGASKMYYYAYLFPSIRMSKKGSPLEKMTPVKGAGGALTGWKAGSARSSAMNYLVKKSFRSQGPELITFSQLLARSQPYSVMVVSTFYTDPSPIKDRVAGGPDQMVTVKVKGVLFGLDLDPAKAQPVGTVLCTGFYSSEKHAAKEVTGKLLAEAARNLGDQFESFGKL